MGTEKHKSSTTRILLIIITYATMVVSGVVENLKGVTFPLIKDVFNASYDFQGYLVSISWYGYVIFCLVSAVVTEKYGVKVGIACGYICILVGCTMTGFVPNFFLVIISLMAVWMGIGFWEVSINALAQNIFTANSAIYLNLMHFFYGIGAIFGPQIATFLLQFSTDSYKGVYKLVVVPVLFVFLLLLCTPFNLPSSKECGNNANSPKPQVKLTVGGVLKMPYVWLCSLTLGFMEVIEFSASNWGGLYYRDVYGFSIEKEGARFVSMFYVLFALTRLFSGFIIEKLGYYTSLFLSLIIVIIIYIVGFLLGKIGIWVHPFTGFFIGMQFPTFMCLLMQVFKENTSLISSVVIFLSGATNGLIQLLIGYINEYIGNAWGYRATILYTLIPLILLSFVYFHDDEVKKNKNNKTLPIRNVTDISNPPSSSTTTSSTIITETNATTIPSNSSSAPSEQLSSNVVIADLTTSA